MEKEEGKPSSFFFARAYSRPLSNNSTIKTRHFFDDLFASRLTKPRVPFFQPLINSSTPHESLCLRRPPCRRRAQERNGFARGEYSPGTNSYSQLGPPGPRGICRTSYED